jgi:hypothetical protein
MLEDTLRRLHEAFALRGIWHSLAYGTLLGAVRDGALIPWDYDIDLFVRPDDAEAIADAAQALAPAGIALVPTRLGRDALALNLADIREFWTGATGIFRDGRKVGDLYAFQLFSDGVLRRYDFATETYWCPHSSFPHFFLETEGTAVVGGVTYPTLGHAERFLAGVYGEDWRTPYRAMQQGGAARDGTTVHGDRYGPKLREEIAWACANGWDRARYAAEREWPRDVLGAGPRGPTPRTAESSGSLWWRDRDELLEWF